MENSSVPVCIVTLNFSKIFSHRFQNDVKFEIDNVPRRHEQENLRMLLPSESQNGTLSWKYFVRQKSRTFDGFSGLAKNFILNQNTLIFSSEMHPFSGLQALYDSRGDLLFKVEEYYVPPRKVWFPSDMNR